MVKPGLWLHARQKIMYFMIDLLKRFFAYLCIMLTKSDCAKRISVLLFEAIILTFILSFSWDHTPGENPRQNQELSYKAISARPIVLTDNSTPDLLKNPISQLQEIECPAFSINLSDIQIIASGFFFRSLFRRNTFFTCISINAP